MKWRKTTFHRGSREVSLVSYTRVPKDTLKSFEVNGASYLKREKESF